MEYALEGGAAGPALIGTEYDAEEIADIAVNGVGDMPADMFQGSDEELDDLVQFILSANEEASE